MYLLQCSGSGADFDWRLCSREQVYDKARKLVALEAMRATQRWQSPDVPRAMPAVPATRLPVTSCKFGNRHDDAPSRRGTHLPIFVNFIFVVGKLKAERPGRCLLLLAGWAELEVYCWPAPSSVAPANGVGEGLVSSINTINLCIQILSALTYTSTHR